MSRKIFRNLISQKEATEIFYSHIPDHPLSTEKIPLNDALGRVIATDIFSTIDVPPFDRASMDGFAVKSEDTTGADETNPINLKIVGELQAGYVYEGIVEDGECVEISTGAPMPAGTNAVVMVEYSDRSGDTVDIFRAVTPAENTMAAGTDIQRGERIIPTNRVLTSRELGVLAAVGTEEVEVVVKPSIGIFSSGDEIISPGEELKPGKLYDINSTSIMANILENGGDPTFLGILPDQKDEIEKALQDAIDDFDIVIISGGTSAGMGDILYRVIDNLGDPGLVVHGVKVKPGKPTILAVCDGTPMIGLPGYPASALSIFQLFVQPLVRKKAGLPPLASGKTIKAIVKQRIRSPEGRHEFKPVYLMKGKDGWLAYPVPGGSGAITSVALADGFIQIPEHTGFVAKDAELNVELISENIEIPSLQIIGSHDMAISLLQKQFEQHFPAEKVRAVSVGSSGGVSAIRRGEAHIAGIHLLDPDRGYNTWVLDDLDATLIPGFYRMQGFIVQEGNPKDIFTIEDLKNKDVKFLNRNPGSGTRILFDFLLSKAEINTDEINGYNRTARSHSSAAHAVKSGIVDVSIGIQAVTETEGLEFVSVREEEYDLLVHNSYIDLDVVKKFIEELQSEEFRNVLIDLPGYRPKN